MAFLGKQRDLKSMQAAMNIAAQSPDYSGLNQDIAELEETYNKSGFVSFNKLAAIKLVKWRNRVGDFQMPDSLYATIADAALKAEYYQIAEQYFDNGLAINSKNRNLLVGMGKVQALKGRFEEAEAYFQRAWKTEPDVFTAGKYAELMFVNGRDRSEIQSVIGVHVEEALTRKRVRVEHGIVLASHVLCLPENQQSEALVTMRNNNGFSRVDEVMSKVEKMILHLSASGSAGKQLRNRLETASLSATRSYPYMGDTELTQGVKAAFIGASGIWNDAYRRAPVSKDTVRAAGGSRARAYRHS